MEKLSRRMLLKLLGIGSLCMGGASVGVPFGQSQETSSFEEGQWLHGLSLLGVPKYLKNFPYFSYVNPQAPKAGKVRLGVAGSFDSLNTFSYKGEVASFLSLTYDTLMVPSHDEPNSVYGLLVEGVKVSSDYSKVAYRLRSQCCFHDRSPLTVEDVVWSLEALKRAHPQYAMYYRDVLRAEKTGDREVTFFFSKAGNRELPQIVGQLPVMSHKWWTSQNAQGKSRDIMQTTLEVPLGSGPYRIKDVRPGSLIVFERVKDYWGRDLPVNLGSYNFDEIIAIYFADEQGMLDQFKAGEYDFRLENSAKNWATGYDFPALQKGQVKKEQIPSYMPQGMQAFVFNLRRPFFSDIRVREALNRVFNFEWANENLFFSQYTRTNSYFANSEFAARNLPEGRERVLLEPFKDQLPAAVFEKVYEAPLNRSPEERRQNLLQASQLLAQAGLKMGSDGVMRSQEGVPFSFEFLLASHLFERIVLPYVRDLKRLGIIASVRTIDSAQYERRVQQFDYDVIVGGWGQSLSPGNEQRNFWGSAAADQPGSQNYLGIKNPVVDRLIDQLIFSRTREDLVAACRALDRVLLWNHYVVPMWYLAHERIAYWNKFGKPDPFPKYSVGFPTLWWWDEKLAQAEYLS